MISLANLVESGRMVLMFIRFFNASSLHLNQAGHPVGVQAGRLKRGLSSVFHYCSDFSQSCKMSQIWQIYLCKFSWTEMICVKKWHFANLIFRCSNIYILLFYPFFFSQWLLYGDNDIFHIFQVHFPLRFCPGKRFDWMEGEVRKTQVRSFWWQMMMTNDDDKGQWWWWNAVARDTRSRSLPLQWLLGHRSQGMGGHQTGLENPPKIPKGKTFFEMHRLIWNVKTSWNFFPCEKWCPHFSKIFPWRCRGCWHFWSGPKRLKICQQACPSFQSFRFKRKKLR